MSPTENTHGEGQDSHHPACLGLLVLAMREKRHVPPREDASPLCRSTSPLSVPGAWSDGAPLSDSAKCLKPQEVTLGPNVILRERLTAWDRTGKPYVTCQARRAACSCVTRETSGQVLPSPAAFAL